MEYVVKTNTCSHFQEDGKYSAPMTVTWSCLGVAVHVVALHADLLQSSLLSFQTLP